MRIALVTTSFLPVVGGAEFVVHHLGQQWCRQGHDVCVINTIADRPTQADALYSVRRFSTLRGSSRWGYHRFPFSQYATYRLAGALAEYKADLISAHFGYPTGVWLSRMRPVPRYLITCHGPALNVTHRGPRQRYGINDVIAAALNASIGAVAISSHARQVMEEIGVEPSRIIDIPNGVDLERFQKTVSSFDLRRRFDLPRGARVVLSVGRELWAKAYDTGITAFSRVASKAGDAFYVILGRGTGKWRVLTEELGVADRVRFCDGLYGEELIGAYQQADVFFLPSVKELCPVVIPEAMASGKPCVVTNVSGSQDMVRHGENGFVIEPGEADEMSNAILALLEDPALRKQMGEASRNEARLYGWDRLSRVYLEHM